MMVKETKSFLKKPFSRLEQVLPLGFGDTNLMGEWDLGGPPTGVTRA